MEKNINFWSCSVRKAFCYVICLLTLVKIMLILMFNNILYISSKWSNWVTVMNCKMNRSISMFWVCYFVFPFQRRGLETLTRKWKGSRGRGFFPPQEFHKALSSPHPHVPASPRGNCYFPFVFLIQLQVEDHWNLYDTVLTLLLICSRNQAHEWAIWRDPWIHLMQG